MTNPIDWKRSVFSDGSSLFLDPRVPRVGDRVRIRLRAFADAPIGRVWLWTRPDNREITVEMRRTPRTGAFAWWEGEVELRQPCLPYHFIFSTDEGIFYHTARGLLRIPPPADHDFRLLAMDDRPDWVEEAVFYQIFPDRFRNGDARCNVRDGAWQYRGFPTRFLDWHERPLEYDEGGCLDFFGGDLDGIREGLDYLEDLGVNALYLNPIFHGLTHHKYDCIDYGNVDPGFGGNDALARLVAACHERDMRVMLDISVNHVGSAHAWFDREGLFGGKGAYHDPEGPLGELFLRDDEGQGLRGDPFLRWLGVDDLVSLDYGSPELRRRIYEGDDSVLRRWLRPPYDIDGWRFDVAFMMARQGVADHHAEVWRGIRKACKEEKADCYLISEDWTDASAFLRGDMFDGVMNYFGLSRPLRQWCGQADHFVAKLGGDLPPTPFGGEQLRDALAQNLSRLPHALVDLQFNLIDSHDWSRLHHQEGLSLPLLRGAVALLFAFPGTPSIYYGDEVGIGGHLRSNEGCRWPFPWDGREWNLELRSWYRDLARLRRDCPTLRHGSFMTLLAEGELFAMARFTEEEIVLLALSKAGRERALDLPVRLVGAWEGLEFRDLHGKTIGSCREGRLHLTLPPEGCLVLRASMEGELP